jgi:hypothetical protein
LIDVVDRIDTGNVLVNNDVIRDADQLFGWGILEIEDAYRKLQSKHFYKSESSRVKPGVFLDVYKGKINGERIYTHFYIDEQNLLIINSFKRQ